MSLSSNARDVAFFSGYKVDKIVNVFEGSFDAGSATTVGGYLKRHSFPHGYTRPVFTKLIWSTDDVNWVDGGYSYRSGDASFYPSIAYSDASDIFILTGLTSGTVYYKVIATWIHNYDGTDPAIDSFISPNAVTTFDSRLNYQKIKETGMVTGTGADIPIIHDLGYYPNARVYFEAFSGEVWPANAGGASNYFLYDFVNQEELQFHTTTDSLILESTPSGRDIWYTVYYDD